MSNRKKILIGLALTILLIMFFLPTFIKYYAVNNSKELISRNIDIGRLKYNYLTSTVKVYDVKIFESNDKDDFITLETLILKLEPLHLFKDKLK